MADPKPPPTAPPASPPQHHRLPPPAAAAASSAPSTPPSFSTSLPSASTPSSSSSSSSSPASAALMLKPKDELVAMCTRLAAEATLKDRAIYNLRVREDWLLAEVLAIHRRPHLPTAAAAVAATAGDFAWRPSRDESADVLPDPLLAGRRPSHDATAAADIDASGTTHDSMSPDSGRRPSRDFFTATIPGPDAETDAAIDRVLQREAVVADNPASATTTGATATAVDTDFAAARAKLFQTLLYFRKQIADSKAVVDRNTKQLREAEAELAAAHAELAYLHQVVQVQTAHLPPDAAHLVRLDRDRLRDLDAALAAKNDAIQVLQSKVALWCLAAKKNQDLRIKAEASLRAVEADAAALRTDVAARKRVEATLLQRVSQLEQLDPANASSPTTTTAARALSPTLSPVSLAALQPADLQAQMDEAEAALASLRRSLPAPGPSSLRRSNSYRRQGPASTPQSPPLGALATPFPASTGVSAVGSERRTASDSASAAAATALTPRRLPLPPPAATAAAAAAAAAAPARIHALEADLRDAGAVAIAIRDALRAELPDEPAAAAAATAANLVAALRNALRRLDVLLAVVARHVGDAAAAESLVVPAVEP
ncbi:hypothetical protein HK405_005507 [Cladochytrium tenue]|nr:hypothetical protein HK405_005507 [Cladochytrium tenue]